jgi:hypothetical protein
LALSEPQTARRASTCQLVGIVALVFLVVFGGLALAVWLTSILVRQLG